MLTAVVPADGVNRVIHATDVPEKEYEADPVEERYRIELLVSAVDDVLCQSPVYAICSDELLATVGCAAVLDDPALAGAATAVPADTENTAQI